MTAHQLDRSGDRVLISVANHLKHALREADTLARLGGDEFIGVLGALDDFNDVRPVLDRLLRAASSVINIDAIELQVSVSVGVSFYPVDGDTADQLIRRADQAMYCAKNNGKNRYHLFSVTK